MASLDQNELQHLIIPSAWYSCIIATSMVQEIYSIYSQVYTIVSWPSMCCYLTSCSTFYSILHSSVGLCDVAFGLLRSWFLRCPSSHYSDVIMSTMASQITSLSIVYSTVNSGTDQRKHQSSASLAFVRGIHRWPVDSPHKGPVTRKMFPFDNVIMSPFNSKWLPCASA